MRKQSDIMIGGSQRLFHLQASPHTTPSHSPSTTSAEIAISDQSISLLQFKLTMILETGFPSHACDIGYSGQITEPSFDDS